MPWHPSLSVGIERIVEQHKEWFNRAERRLDCELHVSGQFKMDLIGHEKSAQNCQVK